MNRMAWVLVLSLVLLLSGTGTVWAAHTHAHVSLSDGENADSDSDDDWGVTCSSQANESLGSAMASSGASVAWDTSHPYFISKTCSTWANTTSTPGYQSSHSPTYAHPYDFNVWLYGAGAVANCSLWLESIELVVPVGNPANFAVVDFNVVVDGTPMAWGLFMLHGDGFYFGDGSYVDSFFDVTFDGDNWRAVYDGPPELTIALPVGAPLEFDFVVNTDANVDLLMRGGARAMTNHTVTFGVPDDYLLAERTVGANLTCVPSSGTVPFTTLITVTMSNLYPETIRRLAGQINVTLGNGNYISSWKAGYTNVLAGSFYNSQWPQVIPALGTVIGDNVFDLAAEDITPPPWNQPPHPPAGDTATSNCVVSALTP